MFVKIWIEKNISSTVFIEFTYVANKVVADVKGNDQSLIRHAGVPSCFVF